MTEPPNGQPAKAAGEARPWLDSPSAAGLLLPIAVVFLVQGIHRGVIGRPGLWLTAIFLVIGTGIAVGLIWRQARHDRMLGLGTRSAVLLGLGVIAGTIVGLALILAIDR